MGSELHKGSLSSECFRVATAGPASPPDGLRHQVCNGTICQASQQNIIVLSGHRGRNLIHVSCSSSFSGTAGSSIQEKGCWTQKQVQRPRDPRDQTRRPLDCSRSRVRRAGTPRQMRGTGAARPDPWHRGLRPDPPPTARRQCCSVRCESRCQCRLLQF